MATAAPWNGWRATSGLPYIPGLNFAVFADAAGVPGALLWSAYFPWDALAPVAPARVPGTAYWRPYNTFSVNFSYVAPNATNATQLPPLRLTANTTYWLALGGAGNRNDSTAGSGWNFQQSAAAALPAGYAAQTAVVSPGVPCSVGAFPPGANGTLAWSHAAAAGSAVTGGPAFNLCDASSPSACTELQVPRGARVLPTGAAALGTSLAATGINAALSQGGSYGSLNALSLPSSYFVTGCTLLAAPVTAAATGVVTTIQLSVADSNGNKLGQGIILGIFADAGGSPGVPLFLAWVTSSALLPVNLPRSLLSDFDDWRVHK